MSRAEVTHRRGFLGRVVGMAAAVGLPAIGVGQAEAQQAGPDSWMNEVKGRQRCLFDFPQHKNGLPLLHILNYLNTYATAYKAPAGQVGAVGTFYGIGTQSSIPMAFNDAMWKKYALGDYTGLKESSGAPYVRNVFNSATKNDLHLLMAVVQTPIIPEFAEAMPGIAIANLQKMGAKFLLCANALQAWCLELQARGKGKAPDLDKELRSNLLPGVTIVPAMVVAIQKAQAAGISYNRQ